MPLTPPHRRIFYCHGFDRRGPAFFRRWQRRELRKYARHHNIPAVEIARQTAPDSWRIGETEFVFLDWSDIAGARLSAGWAHAPAWHLWLTALRHGFFGKIRRRDRWLGAMLAWGFAPQMLATIALVALVAGIGGIAALCAGAAVALTLTGRRNGIHYIQQIAWAARRLAMRDAPALEARIDTMTQRVLQNLSGAETSTETVIVGHSIGAAIALRLVDRCRTTCTDQSLTFITVGQSIPLVSLQSEAGYLRDALSRRHADANTSWIDISAGRDVLGFDGLDPSGGAARCHSAHLRRGFSRQTLRQLRWRGFDTHFQYFRANERTGVAWDWMAMLLDRQPLANRFRDEKPMPGTGARRFPF